jgi:hypothetical protein
MLNDNEVRGVDAEDKDSPRPRIPWWARAILAAVALLMLVGWVVEDRAGAELLPPLDSQFGNGQSLTVTLPAGETRTVYWEFVSLHSGRGTPESKRARAECQVRDRDSGTEISVRKEGRKRVDTWKEVATFTAERAGSFTITCRDVNTRSSQFGVGAEAPNPRLLNGVEDYSNGPIFWTMFGLGFMVVGLIILSITPASATTKHWCYWFWFPLAGSLLMAFGGMNSFWNGFAFWIFWLFGAGWVLFRRWREDAKTRKEAVVEDLDSEPVKMSVYLNEAAPQSFSRGYRPGDSLRQVVELPISAPNREPRLELAVTAFYDLNDPASPLEWVQEYRAAGNRNFGVGDVIAVGEDAWAFTGSGWTPIDKAHIAKRWSVRPEPS